MPKSSSTPNFMPITSNILIIMPKYQMQLKLLLI